MKFKLACAIVLVLVSGLSRASDTELFHLDVKGESVGNGKALNMGFQEIERADGFSIVEVRFTSGGSVSSSMFILRGTCGVARARGEKYFRPVQISKAPIQFRVQFLPEATERELDPEQMTGKVFSMEECALLGF